jgi:hypothetical protein
MCAAYVDTYTRIRLFHKCTIVGKICVAFLVQRSCYVLLQDQYLRFAKALTRLINSRTRLTAY